MSWLQNLRDEHVCELVSVGNGDRSHQRMLTERFVRARSSLREGRRDQFTCVDPVEYVRSAEIRRRRNRRVAESAGDELLCTGNLTSTPQAQQIESR